jgi:hypothetical protein
MTKVGLFCTPWGWGVQLAIRLPLPLNVGTIARIGARFTFVVLLERLKFVMGRSGALVTTIGGWKYSTSVLANGACAQPPSTRLNRHERIMSKRVIGCCGLIGKTISGLEFFRISYFKQFFKIYT